jgi:hypothetical protein
LPREDTRHAIRLTQARLARDSGDHAEAERRYAQVLEQPVLQASRCSPRWLPAIGEWVDVIDPRTRADERRRLLVLTRRLQDELAKAARDD